MMIYKDLDFFLRAIRRQLSFNIEKQANEARRKIYVGALVQLSFIHRIEE